MSREQEPKKEPLVGMILPESYEVEGKKAASGSSTYLRKNK